MIDGMIWFPQKNKISLGYKQIIIYIITLMKLTEIIYCTDLSSERNIEKLLDLFISRRTIINNYINQIVCEQIKDANLKQYYLRRSKEVASIIRELPVIKKKDKPSLSKIMKVKNKTDILDRGGIADDGPLRKMRSLKLQEQAENSTEEKYEYGLSDW